MVEPEAGTNVNVDSGPADDQARDALEATMSELSSLVKRMAEGQKGQAVGWVKVLNSGPSGDFCNYEVAIPFPVGTPPDVINVVRKTAQQLVDEALRQRALKKQIDSKAGRVERLREQIEAMKIIPEHLWSGEMEQVWDEYNKSMQLAEDGFNYYDDEEPNWSDLELPF
jgi:hypothetical protein